LRGQIYRRRRRFGLFAFLLRPIGAPGEPFGHPRRALSGRHLVGGEQKKQAEGMFAGKLSTRARALVCRLRKIDSYLIRLRAAAFAFALQGIGVGT